MIPTTDFRWVRQHLSSIGWRHPSALLQGDRFALVLQQRWAAQLSSEVEEWRDVPMFEADEPRYTITAKGRELLRGKDGQ